VTCKECRGAVSIYSCDTVKLNIQIGPPPTQKKSSLKNSEIITSFSKFEVCVTVHHNPKPVAPSATARLHTTATHAVPSTTETPEHHFAAVTKAITPEDGRIRPKHVEPYNTCN
jgi:hypothetical protein